MKFKAGDRVEHEFYGKGTVIGISDMDTPLVEFDNHFIGLHDGALGKINGTRGTRGKDGHCWFTSDIKHLNNQTIVIYPKGLETIALLKEGNKIIKQATAKCNPSDTYDFNIGARLAFSRLVGGIYIGGVDMAIDTIREVKRPAKVGEWISVTSGDGHRNGVGIFEVTGLGPNNDGWVYVNGKDRDIVRIAQYVVLENYQPESKPKFLAYFTDKELIDELAKRLEDKQ